MELLFENHKINYHVEGNGDAVIFLHGFTESLEIWDEFSADLSLDNRIICIDLPGHGKSENLGEIHTMEMMAGCVKAVLDKENIHECIVIGHSMGGYVALAFAEKFPAMMKGLGLFHSTALADTPEGKAGRAKAIEVIESNHAGFIMNFIPDLFAPANRETLKTEISELVTRARRMNMQAIIAAQKGMMERTDKLHVLKNADYPVLFIAGEQDSRIPYDKVIQQIALPKVSHALLLREIAHMGYLEASEKTIRAVKCFVESAYS